MARKTITADEIRQTVKDENVLFLRLMFTDINGIVKNVEVPISQLEKVLNNKITFDGSGSKKVRCYGFRISTHGYCSLGKTITVRLRV